MKNLKAMLLVLGILLIFGNGVFAQDRDDTIAENVEAFANDDDNPEFTVLLELLDETDLYDVLDDVDAEFTVFAPTDDAFEDLLEDLDIDLDDLLDDEELLTQVLLYHVIAEIVEADDLEDGQEIETVQGGSLTITVDDDEITINDVAEVETADVENSNGIVHVIDAVLLPELTVGAGEPCIVSTDVFDGASVHVGPGNNRTAVTFLEVDVEYEASGQNEDSDGVIWYLLDKEEAAPGRAIKEAWVSSEEVDTSGDCENIGESSAPPVIPIINSSPPNTSDDSASDDDDTANNDDGAAPAASSLPGAGTWTIAWNPTTNASCTGTGNVTIPTVELIGETSALATVNNISSAGFNFFGVYVSSIGNNVFQGAISLDGITGTVFIDTVTTNQMTGRFITSFDTCSATITFTATR